MIPVIYDGTFEGLLTAIFEIFEYKIKEPHIMNGDTATQSLFGKTHMVQSQQGKAQRVHHKLKEKLSPIALAKIYDAYLSEIHDIENVIYRYAKEVVTTKHQIENNYANDDVLTLQQVSKKVHRERHRMTAFVRFQLTADNLYYSIVQPDYNVLPLIKNHFEKRYADQKWLIYDAKRKYGIYYDLTRTQEVSMQFSADVHNENSLKEINDEKEDLYQQLWKTYFSNVNITARKNMKLHIQHMPKRYWKYLTEKRPDL